MGSDFLNGRQARADRGYVVDAGDLADGVREVVPQAGYGDQSLIIDVVVVFALTPAGTKSRFNE